MPSWSNPQKLPSLYIFSAYLQATHLGVGEADPVHLDLKGEVGQVEQVTVVILARRPHVDVQRTVHPDNQSCGSGSPVTAKTSSAD